MKTLLYIAILLSWMGNGPDLGRIARVNQEKKAAEAAFQAKDYAKAIGHYRTLSEQMQVHDPAIQLNLAHAHYLNKDLKEAQAAYASLQQAENRAISSVAYQQLAKIADQQQQIDQALQYLKQSLKQNPANQEARTSYERLLKKKQQQEQQKDQKDQKDQKQQDQKDKQQQQQNQKDKQQQDQQDQKDKQQQDQKDKQQQEQKDKKDAQKKNEGKPQQQGEEEKDTQETDQKGDKDQQQLKQQRMQQIKLSEQQAQMILDALKNEETQYYQQRKRNTGRPSGKDW